MPSQQIFYTADDMASADIVSGLFDKVDGAIHYCGINYSLTTRDRLRKVISSFVERFFGNNNDINHIGVRTYNYLLRFVNSYPDATLVKDVSYDFFFKNCFKPYWALYHDPETNQSHVDIGFRFNPGAISVYLFLREDPLVYDIDILGTYHQSAGTVNIVAYPLSRVPGYMRLISNIADEYKYYDYSVISQDPEGTYFDIWSRVTIQS